MTTDYYPEYIKNYNSIRTQDKPIEKWETLQGP